MLPHLFTMLPRTQHHFLCARVCMCKWVQCRLSWLSCGIAAVWRAEATTLLREHQQEQSQCHIQSK